MTGATANFACPRTVSEGMVFCLRPARRQRTRALMSKRDYYEILGVERTCTEVELKAAFRKLAMQHHPDRNPGDKDCEHRSRNSTRPMTCSRTATSAPPMTVSATPPSSKAAWAAGTASAPISARPSPTSSKASSAWAAARGRALRPRARLRSALQHGDQPRGSLRRQDRADPHSDLGHLRSLLRHRRQGRHQAEDLRDLRRRRPRSATRRASSRSSAPVRPARAAAR